MSFFQNSFLNKYLNKAIALQKLNRLDEELLNAQKSNELINKGHKHAANYIELFNEIYPVQTERLVNEIKELNKLESNSQLIK